MPATLRLPVPLPLPPAGRQTRTTHPLLKGLPVNLTPAQRRTLQAVADGARSAAVTMGRLYDAGLVTDGPDWSGRVVAALTETGGAALETGAGR